MKAKLLLIVLCSLSCTQKRMDLWASYSDYARNSKNYLRWSRDQDIQWGHFMGIPKDSTRRFDRFFGIYHFYKIEDTLKFNVTVYLEQQLSWVRPPNEWTSLEYYDQLPKLFRLRFDYYEYKARLLRKHLIENSDEKNENELDKLAREYYQDAEAEFNKVEEELGWNISDSALAKVRSIVDAKLDSLNDFGPERNTIEEYFLPINLRRP